MSAGIGQIHEVAAEDSFALLHSCRSGITEDEAEARRREVGLNRLEQKSRLSWFSMLVRHFVNFFSLLLDVAAVTCFVADSLQPGEGMQVLGWALLAVSILNALFAFAQEMRAERAMEELRKFLPQYARVVRAGSEQQLLIDQIVPGDVILLREGDRIPADARLVESEGLLINNAPLTGEARSQPMVTTPAKGRMVDSLNIAFAGCSVLRGTGTAVVFATGHRTEFGKIAALSRDVRRPPSPMEQETNRMIRVLTVIAVTMGVLFFAYGVQSGRSLWVNIVFMLGIIVANVPEGLLPTFTLALSMASLRMARKQVLVKSLDAVETLGAVHVICTDKTGTLTKNELAIVAAVDPVSGESITRSERLQPFLKSGLIASDVCATTSPAPFNWAGDPLDVAVTDKYSELFGKPEQILDQTRRHFPFDLQKRREAGLYVNGAEVEFAVKGAWESLRPLIGVIETERDDEPEHATPELLAACDEIVEHRSGQGERVIAVANRQLKTVPDDKAREESLERSLTLLGFLVLDDPLREEVPPAVASCHSAGIQVILITGDHPATAEAIAKKCGILTGNDPGETRVVTGIELESLSERRLVKRLESGAVVFARTTPEQKMKIVSALKRRGLVVGMTGDGVNDAPALKAANVGIAMGISGTDVAREAADIVLLDDNFASMVSGVEEGRAVFANIQKFTTYVLASNIPEIVPFLLYVVLPVPLALTVIQILSIDLGTDILPAIALGQEPPEADAMNRPPRRSDERLLSMRVMATAYLFLGTIQTGWSLVLFFLVLYRGGWEWGRELIPSDPLYQSATGITLSTVILMQIGNVIGRRSWRYSGIDRGLRRNRLLWLGVAAEIAISWAILYFPPVQKFLGTGPVNWQIYALGWLGIPLLFLLDLTRKKILMTFETSR